MVTCNDEKLWRRMLAFKDHGKSYNAVYEVDHPPGFRWLHESIGTNFRITEMQSAIGLIQLKHINNWTKIRSRNASILKKGLRIFSNSNCLIRIPELTHKKNKEFSNMEESWHANYKFYIFLNLQNLNKGWNRLRIQQEINDNGVPCMQGSCSEVYLEKAFSKFPYAQIKRLPIAKELGETSLMFNVHPSLSEKEMYTVADKVRNVLKKASKN